MNPCDLIERELHVGDYVVFHNCIYEVKGLGKSNPNYHNRGPVRIMLVEASKTTRPVNKNSGDVCKLDTTDVLTWKLTRKVQ